MSNTAIEAYLKMAALQKRVTAPWVKEKPHSIKPGRSKCGAEITTTDDQSSTDKQQNTLAFPPDSFGINTVSGDMTGLNYGTEEPLMRTPALPDPNKTASEVLAKVATRCIHAV